MTELHAAGLPEVAVNLFWWKGPDEAPADWRRFLAQAMTFGRWDDMQVVVSTYGEDALSDVLADAPPGVSIGARGPAGTRESAGILFPRPPAAAVTAASDRSYAR